MARNEQLIRQHRILQILERYRFGRLLEEIRDDLVDELGLSSLHPRTVRRDLEALQAAGLHLVQEETGRGRVWKLGPGVKNVHQITASATELIALSLGRDLMYPLVGTPFWLGIESFWNKIRQALPDSVWEHYEKYRRVLYVLGIPAKNYGKHQGILKTIQRAILEHRVVEIEYQSIGRPAARRRIEPYAVVFYQSSLYIIAAAHEVPADQRRMRHLKLDRFLKATALDQWFSADQQFQLDQWLGRGAGIFAGGPTTRFTIRVSQHAAPWVLEDPWHPEQQVERQADGSILLTLEASHEMEIIPRVLALGEEAELIEPAEARRRVAQTVHHLARRYEKTSQGP